MEGWPTIEQFLHTLSVGEALPVLPVTGGIHGMETLLYRDTYLLGKTQFTVGGASPRN